LNIYILSLDRTLGEKFSLKYSQNNYKLFINMQKLLELKIKINLDNFIMNEKEFNNYINIEKEIHEYYSKLENHKKVIYSNIYTSHMIMDTLNQNGTVIYLKKDIEDIILSTINESLISSKKDEEKIKKMIIGLTYIDKIYEKNSDIIINIKNTDSIDDIIKKIPIIGMHNE